MRYKIQIHNYGTEDKPIYMDYEDIIDTQNNNEVVYTHHSIMCGHLLKELNNPKEYNIDDVEEYLRKIKQR